MFKTVLAACLCALFFIGSAEARHSHRSASAVHPLCNVAFPCDLSYGPPKAVREASRVARGRYVARQIGIGGVSPKHTGFESRHFVQEIGRKPNTRKRFRPDLSLKEITHSNTYSSPRPARFIGGRNVCARNVNAALAARGIPGTGSAVAKSFLGWGRASGPIPGAVAVFSRGLRGGHVALVDHVDNNGTVHYLNPSSRRQAWHVGPYNRTPIAYRVPG